MSAEPCTRGSCPACGRTVAYARTVGSGVPLAWEADPEGAWRPLERDQGPMQRLGRGKGSYRLHAPVCTPRDPEGEPADDVAAVEPAAAVSYPQLTMIEGGET